MSKKWMKPAQDDSCTSKKPSSLSSTILDYYNKYGQNRDLEKYLRFRRCGRSSSEESGSVNFNFNTEGASSKSLENLHVLHSNLDFEKNSQKCRSSESLGDSKTKTSPPRNDGPQSARLATNKESAETTSPIKPAEKSDEVKVQIKNAHKSKSKKSWNWNMESNIEITFPQPAQQQLYAQSYAPLVAEAIQPAQQKLALENSETQTNEVAATDQDIKNANFPKTPMRPLQKQIDFECVPPQERPTSPASSIASVSNKQRLEWDSMADIGYDRSSEPSHSRSLDSMTSFERSTLRKYFAERGLSFDENMVVIGKKKSSTKSDRSTYKSANTQTPIPASELPRKRGKDKWETAFRKILDEKHKEMVQSNNCVATGTSKRLWESALKKFRAKYGNRINESDLCITKPEIHSTPNIEASQKLPDVSKGAIPKVINSQLPHKVNPEFVDTIQGAAMKKINFLEKSCQTSTISLASKECQAEVTINESRVTSGESGLSHEEIEDDSATKKGLESAASFEFLSASAYEKGFPVTPDKDMRVMEDKENIPPEDDKENIPPPEKTRISRLSIDKENVPPEELLSSVSLDRRTSILDQFSMAPPAAQNTQKQEIQIDESVERIVHSILSTTGTEAVEHNSSNASSISSFFGTSIEMKADMKKGVDLLNSLVESNQLDKPTKKRMIKKIVFRLLKAKYSDSKRCTSSSQAEVTQQKHNISGVTTLSSTATSNSVPYQSPAENNQIAVTKVQPVEPTLANPAPSEPNDTTKDWLQPMTHSELNYDQRKKRQTAKQIEAIEKEQKILQDRLNRTQKTNISKRPSTRSCDKPDELDENVLKFVSKERSSQLDWIQREINHLVNLKEFLMGEKKKREMDIMKDMINFDSNKKSSLNSERSKINDDVVSGGAEAIYANVREGNVSGSSRSGYIESISSKEITGNSTSNSSKNSRLLAQGNLYPNILHNTVTSPRKLSNLKDQHNKDYEKDTDSQTDWNSHLNMQKIVRNRTKLETPTNKNHETDIAKYARAKQHDFIEKYQTTKTRIYPDRMLYTQPYSSDHYSEPHEARRKIIAPKKCTTDAYTSISSSDLFLSSNSVSVPGVANSTSNTTTHQYDLHHSIGVQTSASLLKSTPIFGNNIATGHTKIITKRKHNKQQQVIPAPVSYTITFNKCPVKTPISPIPKQSTQEPDAQLNSITPLDERLTLKEHLSQRRPHFMSNAEARRKCLHEIANLRQRRNEQRHQLFLLSSNTSLRNNMKYLNPPPISVKRVFTTKRLKQANWQRYKQLPEVLRKEEIERQNKIKRSNRIVTDMFNRDLQRRVLKGNINLSNSMTVTSA